MILMKVLVLIYSKQSANCNCKDCRLKTVNCQWFQ